MNAAHTTTSAIQTVEIENLLQNIGFPVNLNVYSYLAYALFLTSSDETILKSVSKNLYPQIAEKFNTNSACVERSIRHTISRTLLHGNLELQQKLFRYTISPEKGKPTNTEFLSLLSRKLRNNLNTEN